MVRIEVSIKKYANGMFSYRFKMPNYISNYISNRNELLSIHLTHDTHPRDTDLDESNCSWVNCIIAAKNQNNGYFTYKMPNKLYGASGILRQFKILDKDDCNIYFDYQHQTSNMGHTFGLIGSGLGTLNNYVYFHNKSDYLEIFNSVLDKKIIKGTSYFYIEKYDDEFCKKINDKSLIENYFENKFQKLFNTKFEIKKLEYPKMVQLSIFYPFTCIDFLKLNKLKIYYSYDGINWKTSNVRYFTHCSTCDKDVTECKCSNYQWGYNNGTYKKHGILILFTFYLSDYHLIQYKFIDGNGNYFCNKKGPLIHNGIGGYNNYYYYSENNTCNEHIDEYIKKLDKTKSFNASEYYEYLINRYQHLLKDNSKLVLNDK
jgi:hypothetical protein